MTIYAQKKYKFQSPIYKRTKKVESLFCGFYDPKPRRMFTFDR